MWMLTRILATSQFWEAPRGGTAALQRRDAPEPGESSSCFWDVRSNVKARGKEEGLSQTGKLQVGAARRQYRRAAWATARTEGRYSAWAATGASWQVFLAPHLFYPDMGSLVLAPCRGLWKIKACIPEPLGVHRVSDPMAVFWESWALAHGSAAWESSSFVGFW